MPYYAVAIGRKVGIFSTWAECETQVKSFPGAKYKKFATESEAETFVGNNNGAAPTIATRNNFKRNALERAPMSHNKTSSHKPIADNVSGIYKRFSKCSIPNDRVTSCNSNRSNYSNGYRQFSDYSKYNDRPLPPPVSKPVPETVQDPDVVILEAENDDAFDSSSDIDNELCKLMDEIENKPSGTLKRKKPVSKKLKRKAIMIDSLPSKRSSDEISDEPAKKSKLSVFIGDADKNSFQVDNEGFVEVYTDGSCFKNGTYLAKAGFGVYFGENHPLNVSEPVSGRATNNCGEIQAATRAIKIALSMGVEKLAIKTDSQFLINSVTKWFKGWKKKGWKLATGEPVKNEIDFKDLDSVVHLLHVKWVYVKAHRGVLGNERADQLAKEGADKYERSANFR